MKTDFSSVTNQIIFVGNGPLDIFPTTNTYSVILYSHSDGKMALLNLKEGFHKEHIIFKEKMYYPQFHSIPEKNIYLVFESSNLHLLRISKMANFMRNNIEICDSNNLLIDYCKKKDKLRRLSFSNTTNTMNFITQNLDIISTNFHFNIVNTTNIPTMLKENLRNSSLPCKLSEIESFTIRIENKNRDYIAISFDGQDNEKPKKMFYWTILGFLDESSLCLNREFILKPIVKKVIYCAQASIKTMKYIPNFNLFIVCSGKELSLYEIKEDKEDKSIYINLELHKSYTFRDEIKCLEFFEDQLIIIEKNFETKIFSIIKLSLSENLGHKYELKFKFCEERRRILNHATFIDKNSCIEHDKYGVIYISSSNFTTLNNLKISSVINIRDTTRKLLINDEKNRDQFSKILLPLLKGGLKILGKLNLPIHFDEMNYDTYEFLYKFEKHLIQVICKNINDNPLSIFNLRSSGENKCKNFVNWNTINDFYKSSESVQKHMINSFITEYQEYKEAKFDNILLLAKLVLDQII